MIDDAAKRVTFRDERLERRLARDGYVVVPGIASDELDTLRRAAAEAVGPPRDVPADRSMAPEPWRRATAPGPSMLINIDHDDATMRQAFEQILEPVWERLLPRLFVDHEILLSANLAKYPGGGGVMPLHQDGTVVDERRARAVTVWLPLDDIGIGGRNGTLHVLPGSHRAGLELRGTGTFQSYCSDLPRLWPRATKLPVRAGDAVVLDARVVHGSPPNESDQIRTAVTGVVVPRGEDVVHVRVDGEGSVEILAADASFYRRWSPGRAASEGPPDLPVLARMRNDQAVTLSLLLQGARRRRFVAGVRHRLYRRTPAGGSREGVVGGDRRDGPVEAQHRVG